MTDVERRRSWGQVATGTVVLAAVVLVGLVSGCARRPSGPTDGSGVTSRGDGTARGPLVPIHRHAEDLSDADHRKLHVRLIVPVTASDAAIDELIRREVREIMAAEGGDRARDGDDAPGTEVWISIFLDGMDTNSVAYALGIARPGRPLVIQRRQSLQTYR